MAWESKDIDSYSGFYSRSFKVDELDNDAWKNRKKFIFEKSGDISVKLYDIEILLSKEIAFADFYQFYKSALFSEGEFGKKNLVFKKEKDGIWRIIFEKWELAPESISTRYFEEKNDSEYIEPVEEEAVSELQSNDLFDIKKKSEASIVEKSPDSIIEPEKEAAAKKGSSLITKIKVKPGIDVNSTYNDNIYLGSGIGNDKIESDIIYNIEPKIMMEYIFPKKRGAMSLSYHKNFAFYDKNDENNWRADKAGFMFRYNSPSGLSLSVSDSYINTEDPYTSSSSYSRAIEEGVPNIEKMNNDFRSELAYKFNERFIAMLYYDYYTQDSACESEFSYNYNVYETGIGAKMEIAPKTAIFLRYRYGTQDFFDPEDESKDADSSWHMVNTGLLWSSKAKLSGELNFGYQWRDYDYYSSAADWITTTILYYKLSEYSNLQSTLARNIRTSNANSDKYSDDTALTLQFDHNYSSKGRYTIKGLYEWMDDNYEEKGDTYGFDVSWGYDIEKHLKLALSYAYKNKNANSNSDDYENNRFSCNIGLSF